MMPNRAFRQNLCPVWSKVNSHCDGKMYGILLESVQYYVTSDVGDDMWKKILIDAGVKGMFFETHTAYKDDIMTNLARSCHKVTGTKSFNEWMMFFGTCFVEFCSNYGYDKLFRVAGRSYRDFLYEINNIHETIRFSYPRLRSPSFLVLHEDKGGCMLLYQSYRHGFKYYVIGQLTRCAEKFYNVKVKATIVDEVIVDQMCNVKFRLDFDNSIYVQPQMNICSGKQPEFSSISGDTFLKVFPFCIVFDKSLTICSAGRSLAALLRGCNDRETNVIGCKLLDKFRVLRPRTVCSWDKILRFNHVIFLVEYFCDEQPESGLNNPQTPESSQRYTQCPFTGVQYTDEELQHSSEGVPHSVEASQPSSFQSKCYVNLKLNDGTEITPEIDQTLQDDNPSSQTMKRRVLLRGEMKYIKSWNRVAFLCTPLLNNMADLQKLGLYINDLSMFDSSRDMVLAGCQHSSSLERSIEQQRDQIDQITDVMAKTDEYIAECDKILYRMIPKAIALKLKDGVPFVETCESFDHVTIMFMYMVDFSEICDRCEPMEIVTCINNVFSFFDNIIEDYNVFKRADQQRTVWPQIRWRVTHHLIWGHTGCIYEIGFSMLKVETLGDAVYMLAGGVPDRNPNHAANVAELALELQEQAKVLKSPLSKDELQTRIGMHTGNVVGGVVGKSTPQYCLFGDTVNTASRMQTHSAPGRVHISESCNTMLQGTKYVTVYRGSIYVKSKGRMDTYWLAGKEGEEKTRRRVLQFEQERSLAETKPTLINPRPSSKNELDLHGMHESTSYAQLDITASQEGTRPDLIGSFSRFEADRKLKRAFSPKLELVSAESISETNSEKSVGYTFSDSIEEVESGVKFFIEKEESTTCTLNTSSQSLTALTPVDPASVSVVVDACENDASESSRVARHKQNFGCELHAFGLDLAVAVNEQVATKDRIQSETVDDLNCDKNSKTTMCKQCETINASEKVKEKVKLKDIKSETKLNDIDSSLIQTTDTTDINDDSDIKCHKQKTEYIENKVKKQALQNMNEKLVTERIEKKKEELIHHKGLPNSKSDVGLAPLDCVKAEDRKTNQENHYAADDTKEEQTCSMNTKTRSNIQNVHNASENVLETCVEMIDNEIDPRMQASVQVHGCDKEQNISKDSKQPGTLNILEGKTTIGVDQQKKTVGISEVVIEESKLEKLKAICIINKTTNPDENHNTAKSAIESQTRQRQDCYDENNEDREVFQNKMDNSFTVEKNTEKIKIMLNGKNVKKPECPTNTQNFSVSGNSNSLDAHLLYGKANCQKDDHNAVEIVPSPETGSEQAIKVDLKESRTVNTMKDDKNTKLKMRCSGETVNVFEKRNKMTKLQNKRVESDTNSKENPHEKSKKGELKPECHKQKTDYCESKATKPMLGNKYEKYFTAENGKEKLAMLHDKDSLDTKTNGMVFPDCHLTCVQVTSKKTNDKKKSTADKMKEKDVFSVDSNNIVKQNIDSSSKAISRKQCSPTSSESHVKDDQADPKHGRKHLDLNGCSSFSRLFNCHSMKDRFSKIPAKLCDKRLTRTPAKIKEKDTIVTNGETNIKTIVCKEKHANVCITSSTERIKDRPKINLDVVKTTHKSVLIRNSSNFSHWCHQSSNTGLYPEIYHRNTVFTEHNTHSCEQANSMVSESDRVSEIQTAETRVSGQRAENSQGVSKTDKYTVYHSIRKQNDEQRTTAAPLEEGNYENGIHDDSEHETEVMLETVRDNCQLENLKYVPRCRSNCTSMKRSTDSVILGTDGQDGLYDDIHHMNGPEDGHRTQLGDEQFV